METIVSNVKYYLIFIRFFLDSLSNKNGNLPLCFKVFHELKHKYQ